MIQKGWAIDGDFGLYTGWWLTRSEAIKYHTSSLGKTWAQCRAKGDRVVKIEISYL
ncbi:MAG: hypothetical protein QOA70_06815 [Nitrososphaeraceae archaeon]|nr:hypothetical protein [Nitrososphaeraceae archaeon]